MSLARLAVAFRYDRIDVEEAIKAAIKNKEALGETFTDVALQNGTTQRMAGVRMRENLGLGGEFGVMAGTGQGGVPEFHKRLTGGMFGDRAANQGKPVSPQEAA